MIHIPLPNQQRVVHSGTKHWTRSTKENQSRAVFRSPLSAIECCTQSGADSTGCSPVLMKTVGVGEAQGGGCVSQNQTVLNSSLRSAEGLVSLWLLSGGHDYWSEWQIKAANLAGSGGLVAGDVWAVFYCPLKKGWNWKKVKWMSSLDWMNIKRLHLKIRGSSCFFLADYILYWNGLSLDQPKSLCVWSPFVSK